MDTNGSTALIRASWGCHARIISLLMSRGANVNHQNQSGWTALMKSSHQGHVQVIQSLLRQQGIHLNLYQADIRYSPLLELFVESCCSHKATT